MKSIFVYKVPDTHRDENCLYSGSNSSSYRIPPTPLSTSGTQLLLQSSSGAGCASSSRAYCVPSQKMGIWLLKVSLSFAVLETRALVCYCHCEFKIEGKNYCFKVSGGPDAVRIAIVREIIGQKV